MGRATEFDFKDLTSKVFLKVSDQQDKTTDDASSSVELAPEQHPVESELSAGADSPLSEAAQNQIVEEEAAEGIKQEVEQAAAESGNQAAAAELQETEQQASSGDSPLAEARDEAIEEFVEDSASEAESESPPTEEAATNETADEEGEEEEYEEEAEEEAEYEYEYEDEDDAEEVAEEDDGTIKMDWYILKVQSNREKSITAALKRKIAIEGLEDYFGEVIVPTEKVTEFKGGKKKVVQRKLYPGYIVVHMHINDDTWFAVRETSGIGDFTGSGGKPTPMLPSEVARIVHTEEEETDEAPKLDIKFKIDEAVKVKDGTFEGFEGNVSEIDDQSGKVIVMINIFGRSTPVELEYWQIEST